MGATEAAVADSVRMVRELVLGRGEAYAKALKLTAEEFELREELVDRKCRERHGDPNKWLQWEETRDAQLQQAHEKKFFEIKRLATQKSAIGSAKRWVRELQIEMPPELMTLAGTFFEIHGKEYVFELALSDDCLFARRVEDRKQVRFKKPYIRKIMRQVKAQANADSES